MVNGFNHLGAATLATRIGSGVQGSLTAADIRAAYVPNVSLMGSGQVVGLLSFDSYDPNDIQMYATKNGIPNIPLHNVDLPGFYPGDPAVEITMDIEMVLAMAPGIPKIVIYRAPYSSVAALLNEMANPTMGEPLPNQLSTSEYMSYGINSINEQAFKQMAAQGQSFCVASGDDGAYWPVSRSGDFPPADSEYVTSVGGTVLTTTGPAGSWVSEYAWCTGENNCSGGGYGWFPIPPWQQLAVNAANGASTTLRNCPDVAMVATGIEIILSGKPLSASGTSASSPLWAGFIALVNQQAAVNGFPRVGFLNPALYSIGLSAEYASCFHDITVGSNTSAKASFTAGPGYDLVTGWGTPKGLSLINALALRSPLHPPLTGAVLHYVRSGNCDPGPVAGGSATFAVSVTGGAAPFSYLWQTNLPLTNGGQEGSAFVTVSVPPFGQTGAVTVTVTDAAGNTITTSTTISSRDPTLAPVEAALCKVVETLSRFKRPLYVNPGDPGPIDINVDLYTSAELAQMQDLGSRLVASVGSLLQKSRG